MSSTIKTFIKRQSLFTMRSNSENSIANPTSADIQDTHNNLLDRRRGSMNSLKTFEDVTLLEKKQRRLRSRTMELGIMKSTVQCTICKSESKPIEKLSCEHAFCSQCLNQPTSSNKDFPRTCPMCYIKKSESASDTLPTIHQNEKILKVADKPKRSPKKGATVTFAPLPSLSKNEEASKCHECHTICEEGKTCDHCRNIFCDKCWSIHVESLRDQLMSIMEDLDNLTKKLEFKISDFRDKITETKKSITKDTEQKIAGLIQDREERLKKTDEIVTSSETSAEEIKLKIHKVLDEVRDQKDESFDSLSDEQQKVNMFLSLQQKANELITTASTWEPGKHNVELTLGKKQTEMEKLKENPCLFYKHKIFTPKTIAIRETVQHPSGLALDTTKERLLVACPGSGQVIVLDRKFKLLRRIYHKDLMAPQGVAFLDETEEIFVTDKWKHCIFVFNRKGEFQRTFCGKGSGNSQLRSPEGLAFHPKTKALYIADTGNDRILILEKDGAYLGNISYKNKQESNTAKRTKGAQNIVNYLNQPTDVAVSSTRIAVADCGNHKVKVFDHEGQIIRTYGGLGTLRGYFKSPQVVEIDDTGNVIVGDSGNGRVQIFSADGELLRILGDKGNKSRQFNWVSGVLMKDNYDIFIADSKSNTIQLL